MASSNAGGMRRKSPPRHSRESGNPFAKTLNSYPFVLSVAERSRRTRFPIGRGASIQVRSQGCKHGEFSQEWLDSRFRGNDTVGVREDDGAGSREACLLPAGEGSVEQEEWQTFGFWNHRILLCLVFRVLCGGLFRV